MPYASYLEYGAYQTGGTVSQSQYIWTNWVENTGTITITNPTYYQSGGAYQTYLMQPYTLDLTAWTTWIGQLQVGMNQIGASAQEVGRAMGEMARVLQPTAEEITARAEAARKLCEARAAARSRARQLFLSCLTAKQRADHEKSKCVYVRSLHGRCYRVWTRETDAGNVELVDQESENATVLAGFCCHPTGVPLEDSWLTQVLALETDEDTFLRVTNITRGERPPLGPLPAERELVAA